VINYDPREVGVVCPIMLSSGQQEKVKYLFIDGAYLRSMLKHVSLRYFGGDKINIDFLKLATGYKKTFYYDCIDAKKSTEKRLDYEKRIGPQKELFNVLKLLPGFHVREGVLKGVRRRRQKQIDVMIAVEMLTHSFRGNMDEVTFLTGDLDFKPLVDALVLDGMYVNLWYHPDSASKELIYVADSNTPITVRTVYNWSGADFQRKYQIPSALSTPENEVRGYDRLKEGKTSRGSLIELFKKDDMYCIVFPNEKNPGFNIYVRFQNLDFLEKYVRDVYSDFRWE